MRKILPFLLFAFIFFPLSSQQIKVGLIKGLEAVPSAYMLENYEIINEIPVQYIKYNDAEAFLPAIIKKEADVGFLPVNAAVKAYFSTNKAIICCGITENGNLSLITKDKNIKRFADLTGKKIAVAGKNNLTEYVFRFLLNENQLSTEANGVKLSLDSTADKIVPALLTDKIKYAVVPEPFATIAALKSKDVIYALNLQEEYEYFAEESKKISKDYPSALMVVRKDFAEKNPEILKLYFSAYEEACKWTINHPVPAGKLCEKYELGLSGSVAAAAIPKADFTFISAEDGRASLEELLKIFAVYDSEAYGSQLPDEDFYFSASGD